MDSLISGEEQKTDLSSQSRPLVKSRSHHGLLSTTASSLTRNSTYTGTDLIARSTTVGRGQKPSGSDLTGPSTHLAASTRPQTGLSLAYDLHVRKSKSSLSLAAQSGNPSINVRDTGTYPSLSTSRNGSLSATVNRAGSSSSYNLGYQYRRTGRPAPPAPVTGALPQIDSPHRLCSSAVSGNGDVPSRTPRPLPIPPVGISRSQSSNLLRPTASSLARMQATVQPPSLTASTPRAPGAASQQRTTYNQGVSTPSLVDTPALRVGMASRTPHKKASYLVPKSPHRRAMEKHTAAGRVIGASGGAAGAFKSKPSTASLAMSQKQREIEERRRARVNGGIPLF